MEITQRIGEYVTQTGLENFPPDAVEAAKGDARWGATL